MGDGVRQDDDGRSRPKAIEVAGDIGLSASVPIVVDEADDYSATGQDVT